MKAFKTPIHGTGTLLLPLSIYAVVLVDFWPDVADKGQEVIQDFFPVLPEVGLKDGHLLLGFFSTSVLQLPWDPRAAASLALNSSLCRRYCSISAWAAALACFNLRFFRLRASDTFSPSRHPVSPPGAAAGCPATDWPWLWRWRRRRRLRGGRRRPAQPNRPLGS